MRTRTLDERRRLYLLARSVLESDYGQALSLDSVAGGLAVSPRQLQRLYAQFGQLSFREDLAGRRMAAAAVLLRGSNAPIGEVARLVGCDPSHFARSFHAHHGVCPREFRASGFGSRQ
jgi:AraC-like DNA-binding protein